MGLDIFFHKCKRENFAAYEKAHKEWAGNEPESGKISCEDFDKLDKDEQEKIRKDIQEWYDKEPTYADNGISDIGYFRKVNFLMEFFAYTGNCEFKEISKEELEDLKERCKEISSIKPSKIVHERMKDGSKTERTVYSEEDIQKCEELLPTQSGFFYGSTEYDEWYFRDVDEVYKWVLGVLDELKDDEVVLMYCWW